MVVNRFEVYLVNLDPTIGHEIQKTRPCLIISPNEINHCLATVIVAPMTSRGRAYPVRVPCRFQRRDGQIALDHLRAVDKVRLVKYLGTLDAQTQPKVLDVLQRIFAP